MNSWAALCPTLKPSRGDLFFFARFIKLRTIQSLDTENLPHVMYSSPCWPAAKLSAELGAQHQKVQHKPRGTSPTDLRLWQRWRCNQQDVGICSRKHFIHDSLTSVDGLTTKELYGVLFPNSQAECLLTNQCHCMRQCYFSRVAWVCLNMLRPQSLSFEIFC